MKSKIRHSVVRVLLIDNDKSYRSIHRRLLNILECSVHESTQEEAFNLASEDFNIVFISVIGKMIDAEKLLKHISDLYSHLPIVLISHEIDLNEKQVMLDLGIKEIIDKPVTLEEFNRLIHSLQIESKTTTHHKNNQHR